MIQLLILFTIHWIADFVLQPEDLAKNKSKSITALAIHVYLYTGIMFMPAIIILGVINGAIFLLITFIAHFITDYFTSKWTSKLYKQQKYYGFPAFFSVIGLDQLLHQAQIILCYYLLLES